MEHHWSWLPEWLDWLCTLGTTRLRIVTKTVVRVRSDIRAQQLSYIFAANGSPWAGGLCRQTDGQILWKPTRVYSHNPRSYNVTYDESFD
jgi:hypothetical protein